MKVLSHLYEFREQNNLTLRQLSALSGLSRNYLNKIENGVSLPKIDEAYTLADIFHTTITKLFERVE
jgi:transcriptional regulator with XRE-family HTH domain